MTKLNDRRFSYFTAATLAMLAILSPLRRAPSWRLHKKLHKYGWNTIPNNAQMNDCPCLNLGEVVYILIIFHILLSFLT